MEGIGAFLTLKEAQNIVFPIINTVLQYLHVYEDVKSQPVKSVIQKFAQEYFIMGDQQSEGVVALLRTLYIQNKSAGKDKQAKAIKEVFEAISFSDLDAEIAPSEQNDPFLPDYPDDLS